MTAPDTTFQHYAIGIDGPYTEAAPVTPDDATDLAWLPTAIHNAGTAGTCVCRFGDTTDITLYLDQGATKRIRPTRIMQASTAGALVALR